MKNSMHVDFYKNIEPPNLGGKKKRISDYIGSISHLVTTIINQLYIYIELLGKLIQYLQFNVSKFDILSQLQCTTIYSLHYVGVGRYLFFFLFFFFLFFYKNLNFTITNFSGQLNNNVYTLKNI